MFKLFGNPLYSPDIDRSKYNLIQNKKSWGIQISVLRKLGQKYRNNGEIWNG